MLIHVGKRDRRIKVTSPLSTAVEPDDFAKAIGAEVNPARRTRRYRWTVSCINGHTWRSAAHLSARGLQLAQPWCSKCGELLSILVSPRLSELQKATLAQAGLSPWANIVPGRR